MSICSAATSHILRRRPIPVLFFQFCHRHLPCAVAPNRRCSTNSPCCSDLVSSLPSIPQAVDLPAAVLPRRRSKHGPEAGLFTFQPSYTVTEAALNAYTRILAKKYPSFCTNCVSPDMNCNSGILNIDEGAESIVRVALLPNGSVTGQFFIRKELTPF
ncbi:hypothetical protein M0R45_005761 [Rubus argutus]|uniref:Uncharacterized protein n=1 Tax=Rubus argutus TaxID=59490 RepID=A0AAW1YNJ0_RUBAR